MKIGRCSWEGQIRLATIDEANDTATFLAPSLTHGANPLLDLILAGSATELPPAGTAALRDVRFLAPFSELRRNVFAVGKNYREHAAEFDRSGFNATTGAAAIPEYPQFFSKATTTLSGPNDPIRFDHGFTRSVDYEGEIGVIIGKTCRRVAPDEAMDHVFGYVLLNDVTARDLQKQHVQWHLGKSLDTFCPLGPWIATRDEIQPQDCLLRTWVNGELRQEARFSDLIFDVPTLISTLSQGLTLLPGDIIATGTPVGVGIGFSPPRFLQNGDVVRVAANGLGELHNPVSAQEAAR
ncbi:fumarylacetoacetate hydrolase family protein [Castellaniella sp.]|uniref:fumarylacetoacetate hydrolase family protein n=1 Tax=Castellaniella sp. TaxID=1955812 RepID=UPI003C747975